MVMAAARFLFLWDLALMVHFLNNGMKIMEKCQLIKFPTHADNRGVLSYIENGSIPFSMERVFWIYQIGQGQVRGGHAHRTCAEILIPVMGAFSVDIFEGTCHKTFVLNRPHVGLLIPPMVWCELNKFTNDAVCLCLASQPYISEGYIHDFNHYIEACK